MQENAYLLYFFTSTAPPLSHQFHTIFIVLVVFNKYRNSKCFHAELSPVIFITFICSVTGSSHKRWSRGCIMRSSSKLCRLPLKFLSTLNCYRDASVIAHCSMFWASMVLRSDTLDQRAAAFQDHTSIWLQQ